MFEGVSFYELRFLPFSDSVKDEVSMAMLHGIDLTKYLKRPDITSEELREYRLALQVNVPILYTDESLNFRDYKTLQRIRKLHELAFNLAFLDTYIDRKTRMFTISETTVQKILDVADKIDVYAIDFNKVKSMYVDGVLSALVEGRVDVDGLRELAYTKGKMKVEQFDFLISLLRSGVDVRPFVSGVYSKEQLVEIVRNKDGILASDLLVKDYINEFFSPLQIREVLRGLEYNKDFTRKELCRLDSEGYPIYNEYQMYELVEGLRFRLDVDRYKEVTLSDFEMRKIRESLINDQELRGNRIRNKLRIIRE